MYMVFFWDCNRFFISDVRLFLYTVFYQIVQICTCVRERWQPHVGTINAARSHVGRFGGQCSLRTESYDVLNSIENQNILHIYCKHLNICLLYRNL